MEDYAKLYVKEVVKLHSSLIYHFCWSTQFASHFWKAFQKGLGTKFKLNTTSHSRTYGKVGNTIQTLDDMLRECVIYFKGNCDDHLPLIEFSYKNNYHSSIIMTFFEALNGGRYSPVGWFEVGEISLIGVKLVYEAIKKVWLIGERLKTTKSWQNSYDKVRRRDIEFKVNEWVYLKISPMPNEFDSFT